MEKAIKTNKDSKTADVQAVNCETPYYTLKEVTCYKTSDGKLFESEYTAQYHQKDIDDLSKAESILDEGGCIADCLRVFGFTEIDPVFEKVNRKTEMVISHWQGKDTPGYKVLFWESKTRLMVGGNVGSWSGSYRSTVQLSDLARYAKDKRTVFNI